jgi:hypothetical protein
LKISTPPLIYTWRDKAEGKVKGNGKGGNGHLRAQLRGHQPDANSVRDATSYLRHAKTEMTRLLRTSQIKEFDEAHLLALLALKSLEGES